MTDIQKTTLSVYALIMVGSLLMLVPMGVMFIAGLSCLLVGLMSAYIYRAKANNPQMKLHMTYGIRTVWWATLLLIVGVMAFASIIYSNGDLSMIYNLMERADSGVIPTEGDLRAMQYSFVQVNRGMITMASLALLPYPLYLIIRMVSGARRVLKTV